MSFDKFVKKQLVKKKGKTTLEKEESEKKATQAGEEYLTAVGAESEDEGAKWTIEAHDKLEKQEKVEHEKALEEASKRRKTKLDYLTHCAIKLAELADTIDWAKGYRYRIGKEGEDKLSLLFEDKKGNVYARGIKLTGIVEYDVNALHVLVTQAENTVDSLEGRLASQKQIKQSPLWTPGSLLHEQN